jgi:hypothetical protein
LSACGDDRGLLYESIGRSYAATRREDPRIAAQIHKTLVGVRILLNVGAGTGSYEPNNIQVVAVEPSLTMIRQRDAKRGKVVRAVAEDLPFRDRCFDAAMALWTVHHWKDLKRGFRELQRVSRRVVLVLGTDRLNQLWLTRDYFPSMAQVRRPAAKLEALYDILGNEVRIDPLMIPIDCEDGFSSAFWGRPEAYLDPVVRHGISTFQLLTRADLENGLHKLRRDLTSGDWDRRHGRLRTLSEFDCGLRLVISE